MTSDATASEELHVLWLDDEPEAIENFQKILKLEQSPLRLTISHSPHSARELLGCRDFDAVVVDLRTDKHDDSDDGASFLLEVNETRVAVPTAVYSAFLEDPRYAGKLKQGRAVLYETKAHRLASPLREQPLFRGLEAYATRYHAVARARPEEIAFRDYRRDPARYAGEVAKHWQRHGHWIERLYEREGFSWGVVCGRDVVLGGKDLRDFPDDGELAQIGELYNLIPFAYSNPAVPEESCPWCVLSSSDYYPTVDVTIDHQPMTEDFDTGAPVTSVGEHIVPRGWLDFQRSAESVHLGEKFRYFTKKARVGVRDKDGVEKSSMLALQVISDWHLSPFVKVNRQRNALVGRDILRDFSCEIVLNSSTRRTEIHHLKTPDNDR